jgi:hypothetical protein
VIQVLQRCDFEVLRGQETIAAERSIMLRNTRAAWPRIAKLAMAVTIPGCLIRVRDQSGAMVIVIGVAAALRSLNIA